MVGIDGCRGGWYAVMAQNNGLVGRVFSTLDEAFAIFGDEEPVGVDIPLGLVARGRRTCDVLARELLGPRRSSIFFAPIRPLLDCQNHAEACALSREIEDVGVSLQTFYILLKIREADALLRRNPTLGERVFEVHPELAFSACNGGEPLPFGKKTAEGREERLALLRPHFGDAPERLLNERDRKRVSADDVLDALIVLWSVRRIERGEALCLPDPPERDEFGLPMSIRV